MNAPFSVCNQVPEGVRAVSGRRGGALQGGVGPHGLADRLLRDEALAVDGDGADRLAEDLSPRLHYRAPAGTVSHEITIFMIKIIDLCVVNFIFICVFT